jgi:hypothetical protein
MPDGEPVSWRGLVYGTAVVASDGTPVGSVREVLGSDADDIFHGLRVHLAAGDRDVMVAAEEIDSLGSSDVRVGMTAPEIAALPKYDESATYHLASVGWLRKHLGWKQDSKSDEEAG